MIKKSFNEEVSVAFNEYNHSYFYNDKKLQNATTFIGKFYKKFDVENVAPATAKSWGVDEKELRELWKSNGDLAGDFGTAVHKALEHYFKYRNIGKTIQDKKFLNENYAMPKHPLLKRIVKEFLDVDKSTGELVPEALLTDTKRLYCGTSDRIEIVDLDKKICRVGDYKINVDSEELDANLKASSPFETLPANKITKYQIQLSFYGNLLQAAGWTVEALDVYVLEGEWKHYQLEVLKVI